MQLRLEIDGEDAPAPLPGEGAALVAFMSFAVSRGFGATHPLIALADRLHDERHVRLGPLTTFYEAGSEAEDAEDLAKLELAWQDAAGLRESLLGLACALERDAMAVTLARRGGAEGLGEQAAALAAQLEGPETQGKRVRLVYAL